MEQFLSQYGQIIVPLVVIWNLVWKGLALWKASKKDSRVWFVILLVFNTIGILEILYFFLLNKIDLTKYLENIKSFFTKIFKKK